MHIFVCVPINISDFEGCGSKRQANSTRLEFALFTHTKYAFALSFVHANSRSITQTQRLTVSSQ